MTGAPERPGRSNGLIVVAEHEPEVAEMIRRYLERARLPVWLTDSPAESMAWLRSRQATAYVLDLTMPGLDIRLVRRALASGPATSAVFLLGARAARPRGLASGPGSRRWLVRPFSPRTLVEAVLEPPPRTAPDREDGPFARLDLTPGEQAILAALAAAGGRVVSREQLLTAINQGHGKIPSPRAVDVYVTQLRAKLGNAAIRTVRGVGYALSDHFQYGSWQGKPKANSRGPAPHCSEDGASIA